MPGGDAAADDAPAVALGILAIGLLSDPEGEVCRRYGVLQEKETDGVRKECLVRSTFVIDTKGVIRHAAYGVNPKHHAAEIYDVVRKLKS